MGWREFFIGRKLGNCIIKWVVGRVHNGSRVFNIEYGSDKLYKNALTTDFQQTS